jgi:hypothetical protein
MFEHTEYRLAFILPHSRQVLGIRDLDGIGLPRLEIPTWERSALQLTRRIEEKWRIKGVILNILSTPSWPSPCALIEIRSPSWGFEQNGLSPIGCDDLDDTSLDVDERRTITAILNDENLSAVPFARLGWIDEARHWIEGVLPGVASRLRDDVQQYNAGGNYALAHFTTERGDGYWLKAVGAPNTCEFPITKALYAHLPEFLPRLIAIREDWAAWVTAEMGRPLRDCLSLKTLERAVITLATLQKQSARYVAVLLSAGCADRRISVLGVSLDKLSDHIEETIEHDPVTTAADRPGSYQLRQLRRSMRIACEIVQEQEIPDCLVHIDLNPGNILIDESKGSFIDWAEAYIANPFFTFEHLWADCANENPQVKSWAPHLRALYRAQWLDQIPEKKLDRVLSCAPLLSIAAHLCGTGDWLRSPLRHDPNFQKYTVMLTGLMCREASASRFLEARCQ